METFKDALLKSNRCKDDCVTWVQLVTDLILQERALVHK